MSTPKRNTPAAAAAGVDPRHPAWCDPGHCELLYPVPLSDHRSTPIVIDRAEPYDVKVTAWLSAYGYEPVDTVEVYANVRLEEANPAGEVQHLTTHQFRLDQAAQLAAALAGLTARGRRRGEAVAGTRVVPADPAAGADAEYRVTLTRHGDQQLVELEVGLADAFDETSDRHGASPRQARQLSWILAELAEGRSA